MVGRTHVSYNPTIASERLRELLREALKSERADALLLGGLDSSCLAVLDRKIPAFTVGMKGEGEKLDLHFAGMVAKHLKLDWHPILISREEGIDNLRLVIRATKTYDVALLNDLSLFVAINRAADLLGTDSITVRSGEPADTLFRGYFGTYFLEETQLNSGIDNSAESKMPLALLEHSLGIKVDYPFMDKKIKGLAKELAREENITYRMVPGGVWDTHEDNPKKLEGPYYPFGKMTLRRAFYHDLPSSVISRRKAEIQFGSGTDILRRGYLPRIIDYDEAVKFMREDAVHFRDSAHTAMYKLYRQEGFRPRAKLAGETECEWCHGGVEPKPDGTESTHCYTCGGDHCDEVPDESWLETLKQAKHTKTNK